MSPIGPVVDIARGLVREVERTQLRARRGIELIARRPPPRVGNTPKDEVWSFGKAKLWRYRNDDVRHGPPVLMFLGLVGDSAIFDLFPGNSWAEKLVAEGFDVFLFDWGRPEAAEGEHDLGTYMDGYFVPAVDAVRRIAGADEVSVGAYCMGSLMLTLLLGSRSNVPVRNAVLFAPPCDYDHAPGFLTGFKDGRLETRHVVDEMTGLVPEDAVRGMFRLLQPTSDIVQYVTLWENLWRDGYADAHRAINHWAWDHRSMAAPSFVEMVEDYVRENRLVNGGAELAGRPVDLHSITIPLLMIIAEKDEFVPPANSEPLAELVGSDDVEILRIPGGHAGALMGSAARKKTMPGVVDWLRRHSDTPPR
ncbi:alpha/beta fold hydrolase [Rhodococcus opacus]|uniref:Alpha/beta fold hydrolase n=2 Tax=Rhodococcus TaxID=1827 RepID=A0AAX3Y8M3_RHOOP|nr:alpha/beta fold hydrolase [Rhodococcus opacus]MCZ4588237.1 alpha/beta fold hydrolase [Rhodococcus opacus]WLF44364.1 alpha/beta fold hydrolase [Rhodococcus opacus]